MPAGLDISYRQHVHYFMQMSFIFAVYDLYNSIVLLIIPVGYKTLVESIL